MKRLLNKYSLVRAILWLFIIITLIVSMASCSTVRKSQTMYMATSDSTRLELKDSTKLATTDSARLLTKDSTGVTKETKTTSTNITFFLDTTTRPTDYPNTPDEYAGTDTAAPTTKKNVVTVKVDGNGMVAVDLGNSKPFRIDVTTTGGSTRYDSTRLQTKDSADLHKSDSSSVRSKDSSNTKRSSSGGSSSVSRFRIGILLQLAAALFLLFMLFFLFRKLKQKFTG